MTDLSKLRVSLTKHGAHKLAILIRKYDKNEILNHLVESEPGVNIELAQAKKNLSFTKGAVPDLWNEAREKGGPTIDALVLVSIILSHHELINALKNSTDKNEFSGTVNRTQFANEKAYTNLAHTIDELGYSTEHTPTHVRYDFQKLFKIPGLHTLVQKVLRLKLRTAGWHEGNSIIEEATSLGLHEVFSLTKEQFSSWLDTGLLTPENEEFLEADDAKFFSEADDEAPPGKFEFRPGHNEKKTGVIVTSGAAKGTTATLLHNEIQNSMYKNLIAKYGEECVGTEVPTGDGTAIDIVVKTDKFCWFYEIKTSSSARVCIRQAIPQLLEYAYWQADGSRADKLIIVSPQKITPQAAAYLNFLREQFKLNLHYERCELKLPTAHT